MCVLVGSASLCVPFFVNCIASLYFLVILSFQLPFILSDSVSFCVFVLSVFSHCISFFLSSLLLFLSFFLFKLCVCVVLSLSFFLQLWPVIA